MSKTILAPFTHARNFISATAFASANGILPFGNTKDFKAAWNALQAACPGMRKDNAFYQKRSEEHTSELQSLTNLVCRLLLEKKNKLRRITKTAFKQLREGACRVGYES